MRRPSALLLVLLATLTASLTFGAAPAAAKQPCWRALFIDYADGRIDRTYPVHCYRDAVRNLGQDQLTYGSAAEDIRRALAAAMTKMRQDRVPIGPSTIVPPGGGPGKGDGGSGTLASKHDERSFFDKIAHAIGPSSADAVPLPLLILAGLAVLLLAAAGASLIARQVQARRTPPPAPSPSPPSRHP